VVFDASGPPPEASGEARRPRLGELLVLAKVLTTKQVDEALAAQSVAEKGTKLGQVLLAIGWINEAQLTQTLSLQLSVPWVSLYHIDFSRQLLNRVDRELAERYCLIPIFVRHVKGHGETLYVAMDDPTNLVALAEVSRQANLPARPMIASATDIRSALRVYYGEPVAAEGAADEALPTTQRFAPPNTTREGQRGDPEPDAAPPPAHAEPLRSGSQPPPPPPVALRRPSAKAPTAPEIDEPPPPTTRSNPPPGSPKPVGAAALAAAVGDGGPLPVRAPGRAAPGGDGAEARRPRAKMLSLTLLDGTTLQLPAKKPPTAQEGLTARDFVSALRATAHGADATEILGEKPQWEPVVAALLSILLRKGLIADWEFIEELRKS
jgi:type IV pilus assembly protein PilB